MINDGSVTVMVSDIKRAIKFYVETLGLKLIADYGGHYAEISAPNVKIGLHPSGNHDPSPGKCESLSIGFGVDNLDKAVSDLKKKGVKFVRVVDDGPVKLAHFTDTDGNPLYLAETKQW